MRYVPKRTITLGCWAVKESMAGKVALGGCVVFPEAPDRLCRNCGHDWRTDEASS